MLKVGNEKRTSTASLCVIRAQEGRWVQGEAIWAFAGHQHLPWGCPPFWSSARRLRWLWSHIWRWLPFWAGLRAQQPEAGGKGVFPAEATQCSGLSLACQLGLAPARRDTQCHPESEEQWLREVAGSKAAPPCQSACRPSPHAPWLGLAQPSSLPSRQEPWAPPSSFQPRPPGNWQACRPMAAAAQAIPEHTSSSLPLGVFGVQEPAGVRTVSAFPPSPLTLFSRHEMQSTQRKASPSGWHPTFLSYRGLSPSFLPAKLSGALKMLGPLSTVKSQQCGLWSWAALTVLRN